MFTCRIQFCTLKLSGALSLRFLGIVDYLLTTLFAGDLVSGQISASPVTLNYELGCYNCLLNAQVSVLSIQKGRKGKGEGVGGEREGGGGGGNGGGGEERVPKWTV